MQCVAAALVAFASRNDANRKSSHRFDRLTFGLGGLVARADHHELSRPDLLDGPTAFDLGGVTIQGAVVEDRLAMQEAGPVVGFGEAHGTAVARTRQRTIQRPAD